MQIVDQKLGNVGEVIVEVKSGKLVISIEGDVDLIAQLEKLKAAHPGLIADIAAVAEAGIQAISAPPAPPTA